MGNCSYRVVSAAARSDKMASAVEIELKSLATEALVAYDDLAATENDVTITNNDPALPATGLEAARKSGLIGSIGNFVNVIVGGGIIGLGFSFREIGMPFAIMCLVVVAVLTNYSVGLLVEAGVRCGQHSFEGTASQHFCGLQPRPGSSPLAQCSAVP